METALYSSRCVQVNGLQPNISDLVITAHFQSLRKSGGGDIEEDGVQRTSDGKVIVCFVQRESTERVLQKQNQVLKTEDGKQIDIEVMPCPSSEAKELFPQLLETDVVTSVILGNPSTEATGTKVSEISGTSESSAVKKMVQGTQKFSGFGRGRGRGRGSPKRPLPKPGDDSTDFPSHKEPSVQRPIAQSANKSDEAEQCVSLHAEKEDAYEDLESASIQDRTVVVQIVPPALDEKNLRLCLESRKYIGGQVEFMNFDVNKGIAYARFSGCEAVSKAVSCSPISFSGTRFIIKSLSQSSSDQLQLDEQSTTSVKLKSDEQKNIIIQNIPDTATVDSLRYFLEAKSGSSPKSIVYGSIPGSAGVMFHEPPDIAKLTNACSRIKFEGNDLTIKQIDATNAIQVRGFPDGTSKDLLTLYFESPRSKGGKIIDTSFKDKCAVIKFEDRKVVSDVLQQTHKITENILEVAIYYPDLGLMDSSPKLLHFKEENILLNSSGMVDLGNLSKKNEMKEDCAIMVSGIGSLNKEILELVFEKKSDGGEIASITIDSEKGKAVIMFKSKKDATSVLEKGHIKWDNNDMTVSPLPGIDEHHIAVTLVSHSTSRQCLQSFLEAKTKCSVREILYNMHGKKTLVSFDQAPDIIFLKEACKKIQLEGSNLEITEVRQTNTIQVHGIGQSNKDMMTLYFESPRSNGGPVHFIEIIEDYALVTFENPETVSGVVAHGQHTFGGHHLFVSAYYEEIGIISPLQDQFQPGIRVPKDFISCPIYIGLKRFWKSYPEHYKVLLDELGKCHADIIWPENELSEHIQFKCKLTPETEGFQQLAQNWKIDVEKTFDNFMKTYSVKSVNIPAAHWEQVQTFISSEIKPNKQVSVDPFPDDFIVKVIGNDEVTVDVQRAIENFRIDIERKANSVERKVTLKGFQLDLLDALNFASQMEHAYKDMKIVADFANNSLTLRGLSEDIREATLKMYELLNDTESHKYHSSHGIISLLKSSESRRYMLQKFRDKGITAVLNTEEEGACIVVAQNKHDIQVSLEIMEREIVSSSIHIPEESWPIVDGRTWASFTAGLQNDFKGLVMIENRMNDKLPVITFARDTQNINERINDFLQSNTILKDFRPYDNGIVRYIHMQKISELQRFIEDTIAMHVKITPQYDQNKNGFLVQGTQQGLYAVTKFLQSLASLVSTGECEITKPGMPQYFSDKEGQTYFHYVEKTYHCVIEVQKPDSTNTQTHDDFLLVDSPVDDICEVRASANCANGKRIIVMKNDLTNHKSDVIVNAANQQLQHAGGLARAIVDKGGRVIQDECNAYIKRNGDLIDGQVATSSAGNLPNKLIVHAVGPIWRDGRHNEQKILTAAVQRSLDVADKKGHRSIAFPALSSGLYRYPIEKSSYTIIQAVVNYLQENRHTNIAEVHLVDIVDKNIQSFQNSLVSIVGEDAVQFEMTASEKSIIQPKLAIKPANVTPEEPYHLIDKHNLSTKEGVNINLKYGDISSEKVDIIVNSPISDTDMSKGAISNSILKAAGPKMQEDFKEQMERKKNDSDVVLTNGHNLQCRAVFHKVASQWDGGNELRHYIAACLAMAKTMGKSSIAFPIFGTGGLGYPIDIVASTMFDEVLNFSSKNPKNSVKDVRFVVYTNNQQVMQAFESYINQLANALKKKKKESRRFSKSETASSRSDVKDLLFHSLTPGRESGQQQMMVRYVKVQVQQGDILKETTDAIVNSTNAALDLTRGAVAQAIARAGGQAVLDECAKYSGKYTTVVITTAGQLKCKHIIHIDAPSDLEGWSDAIYKSLKEADGKHIKSVTFPALGTGQGNISSADIASTMFDAIGDFVSKENPKHLKLIRLTIFQGPMVTDFQKAMAAKIKTGAKYKDDSTWTKIKKTVKAVKEGMFGATTESVIPEITESLTLYIYAASKSKVEEVIGKIDEQCHDQSKDEIIGKNDQWTDTINQLDDEQIIEIHKLQSQHPVKITVDDKIGLIRIQGSFRDTMEVKSKITDVLYRIISKIKEDERLATEAELLYLRINWEFEDEDEPGQFDRYLMEDNARIERAYNNGESSVIFNSQYGELEITFSDMMERQKDNPSNCLKVRRTDLTVTASDLPASWEPMSQSDTVKLISLNQTDVEYKDVVGSFKATYKSIIKIERIQNPGLYKRYQIHKEQMIASNKQGTQNEHTLWHGTSSPPDSITLHGFNRSYHGKNATAYGKGAYFAVDAQYSVSYADPQSNGHRYMFRCLVLTGEFTQGQSSMIVPPPKDPQKPHILYDSVVNNVSQPGMYIVFQDSQAYPEYLITFT